MRLCVYMYMLLCYCVCFSVLVCVCVCVMERKNKIGRTCTYLLAGPALAVN